MPTTPTRAPGSAQRRTVRATECPVRIWVEDHTLGGRTFSVNSRSPRRPHGRVVTIDRIEVRDHLRYGTTTDGDQVRLGGTSADLWVEA
jgi:hypothetical protein